MNDLTKKLFLLTLIGLFFIVVIVSPVYAQDTSEGGLVPCGGTGQQPCTPCDFFQLGNNIMNFLMSRIVPAVTFLFIVFAGVQILFGGANPAMLSSGKNMMKTTLYGIAIIFGAWMLTNTILKLLAGQNDISDKWYKIECSIGAGPSIGGGGGGTPGGSTPPSGGRTPTPTPTSTGGGGTPPVSSGACTLPIGTSSVVRFNTTVHGQPGSGHGWVRCRSPLCAVDLSVGSSANQACSIAASGVSVAAPFDGVVTEVFNLGGAVGFTVVITNGPSCHSAERCAVLAHVEPSVRTGARVSKGDIIGRVTSYCNNVKNASCVSCGGFGPHLHFEVKINNQWATGDGRGGTWSAQQQAIQQCR